MKALIICSVHALGDVGWYERSAFRHACASNGIPAILSAKDHARVLNSTTMLKLLNSLPGSTRQCQAHIAGYLDVLNDEIWNAWLPAYDSVSTKLLDPKAYGRPTGFVSEYPILTTNLLRSAMLRTSATKLGHVTAQTDPLNVQSTAAGLTATASSLGVAHQDVEVLVAHERDFVTALSLGMHPRFIDEIRPGLISRRPFAPEVTATTIAPSVHEPPKARGVVVTA